MKSAAEWCSVVRMRSAIRLIKAIVVVAFTGDVAGQGRPVDLGGVVDDRATVEGGDDFGGDRDGHRLPDF